MEPFRNMQQLTTNSILNIVRGTIKQNEVMAQPNVQVIHIKFLNSTKGVKGEDRHKVSVVECII